MHFKSLALLKQARLISLSSYFELGLPVILQSETKGPHHIHSLRSSCFIKTSAFNVAENLVMVVKFTFQSVFGNSRRNPRRSDDRKCVFCSQASDFTERVVTENVVF